SPRTDCKAVTVHLGCIMISSACLPAPRRGIKSCSRHGQVEESKMAYTLEQLSADIRHALKADAGPAGKRAVCALVSKVLLDKEFVAQHLTADQCRPRKV